MILGGAVMVITPKVDGDSRFTEGAPLRVIRAIEHLPTELE